MELLEPLEFPEWLKCLYYSWVPWITPEFMLMRGLMVGPCIASRWRLVTRKTNHWLEGWDFEPAQPPGREEGLEIEFKCMVHDLINETPINLWTAKLSGGSLLVNSCWEDEVPSSHGERAQKLCVQDPSRPCPMCLFIWLVWFVSFKTLIVSIVLSSVLCHSAEL